MLKPKDMGKALSISPAMVSRLATDIEQARLHTFHKTALGSYLFSEDERIVLEEYLFLLTYFGRKKEALEMLPFQLEASFEAAPNWFRYLKKGAELTEQYETNPLN